MCIGIYLYCTYGRICQQCCCQYCLIDSPLSALISERRRRVPTNNNIHDTIPVNSISQQIEILDDDNYNPNALVDTGAVFSLIDADFFLNSFRIQGCIIQKQNRLQQMEKLSRF